MGQGNERPSFFQFLPVSLFGSVMGLTGLSFAWLFAGRTWGMPAEIGQIIGIVAIAAFLALTVAYIIKLIRFPGTVRSEFDHPVSVSFFGAVLISLLLLPGVIRQYSVVLAEWVWGVGAVREICLVFYGIGIIFAIIILTIIISRLFFQPPLPEALQPTLLILVGPFALAFSGYEGLTGHQDMIASIFYYFDLFILLLFGSKIFLLPRCCPFRVTWWAVSFPMAAITIAAFRYAEFNEAPVYKVIAGVLLSVSSFVILYLFIQTLYKIFTGTLFLVNAAAEKATAQLHEPSNAGK